MNTDLKLHVAMQCAPVLLGVKMSNILITHPDNEKDVYALFRETGFSVAPLAKQEERLSFLIYRKQWLCDYVNQKENKNFLQQLGYAELSVQEQIKKLAEDYEGYLYGRKEFPHEMGIFLGYPLEDVQGFMVHKGKNYLYSGYWKVYENVEQAKAVFEIYDKARKWLCYLVEQGVFMGRREDLKWIKSM